jgi:hypothetical protein
MIQTQLQACEDGRASASSALVQATMGKLTAATGYPRQLRATTPTAAVPVDGLKAASTKKC